MRYEATGAGSPWFRIASPIGRAMLDDAGRALAEGWSARGRTGRVIAAACRHAVDFRTWQSLARDGGVSRAEAVELASAMVFRAAA